MNVRIGLIGYGVGGRLFHAPYITAARDCEFAGIVTRSPDRVAQARADHPGVPVYGSLGEMTAAGLDAVTVSTPPRTRRELVLEAVGLGLAVLADKPFAPSAQAGRELVEAAEAAGVLLNVFHNRRWDADIVTARKVLDSGALGAVTRLDLRCDQDDPSTLEAGPDGGLLRDLGSHVVDQALHLLGPARQVFAQLDESVLASGKTDVGFTITIVHDGGTHSHVSASKVNGLESRELRLLGEQGSYVSDYRDVQVDAIRTGQFPAQARDTWGYEQEVRWGVLAAGGKRRPVPSEQGDYTALYEAFAQAVRSGSGGPVPALEGVAVLEVLDAARRSAQTGQVVSI
ncbi:Gfo/Idh/MocA family oxidoreductase [Microbacterium sp. 10M-3C3]|jgi:predicted dehydrogenase|uniref:Gfo/Idh/MocA family protein n=1 Tax=Microbacterium sp. 10M-3C3 TaxID=2483401 RepID=UPI000F63F7BF|nr:Gfo/Idh/MocA family oxidoreductase [Microbacterium sp. 10M-3C3]